MQKCHLIQEKRNRHFSSFGGTPMHLSLTKCCFWMADKIERDFEKMKWQVKMHENLPFPLEKKRSDIFPPFGYPYAL